MEPKAHWSAKKLPSSACAEATSWARQQPSAKKAWETCQRGDWMLWIIGKKIKTLAQRKKLVLAACACARLALKHVPEGELRPLQAIETAEKWAKGDKSITIEQVREAAYQSRLAAVYAAYAAVYAAYAAVYAAYAADAAYAAVYAAYAADAAAYAADAAAYAADAAAYAAARTHTLAECANIVRQFYPNPPR